MTMTGLELHADNVTVGDRIRGLREEVVTNMMDSIVAVGQLEPILVRRHKGAYYLIAGQHRLEACRRLKRLVRAEAYEGAAATAVFELAEIDENLCRADLTAAERKLHIARRKELYEQLHPEAAKGKTGRGRPKGEGAAAFADETAKRSGRGRSSVHRDIAHARKVTVLSKIAGTSLDSDVEIEALSKMAPAEQERIAAEAAGGADVSAKTRLKQLVRAEKIERLGAKQRALPEKKFGLIYADPEWRYEPWSRGSGMDRAADNHYPTTNTDEICARPVEGIAADVAVLALWVPNAMLEHGLRVLRAWCFQYVTNYVWVKDRMGMGYWQREKHELLLIGRRGDMPAPAPGLQWESVITAAKGEHSEKPEAVLHMLEEYFADLPKIELNRRGPPRPGWDAWGNEVEDAT